MTCYFQSHILVLLQHSMCCRCVGDTNMLPSLEHTQSIHHKVGPVAGGVGGRLQWLGGARAPSQLHLGHRQHSRLPLPPAGAAMLLWAMGGLVAQWVQWVRHKQVAPPLLLGSSGPRLLGLPCRGITLDPSRFIAATPGAHQLPLAESSYNIHYTSIYTD